MFEVFRNNRLPASLALAEYCARIGRSFCPYLDPAQKAGVLFFSEYRLEGTNLRSLQEDLFFIGVLHSEILRKERARQGLQRAKALICENVIFYVDDVENPIDGAELFSWPHWFLKLLYTEKSMLFGKFWQGETDQTEDGRPIPVPPHHLLSIRSAVKPVDKRFFSDMNDLEVEHANSEDDSQSVLAQLVNDDTASIIKAINEHDYKFVSHADVLLLANELKRTTLYDDVEKWCVNEQQRLGIDW